MIGVKKELQSRVDEIWVQKFMIPTRNLKIANLTTFEPSSLFNAVMCHCERAETQGYCSFLFSQTIAEILRNNNFDGGMVCGVRGNETERYNNVFIFNPQDRWKDWIDPANTPFLI